MNDSSGMHTTRLLLLLAGLLTAACHAPPAEPIGLQVFGSMREVMRDAHHEGRVELSKFARPDTIGVGALAGLAGEVTITDGSVWVATVSMDTATVRLARATDQATLLVAEDVHAWHHYEIGRCDSYAQLEERIGELLRARGHDVHTATPVRVHGTFRRLQVHVIAGACPIATPDGPKPWRYDGPADNAQLVGFYVEGAAGELTHHNHVSHLHAISDQAMGHLDDVVLSQAIVSLPAKLARSRQNR